MAILFDPKLVPGNNALDKAMHLVDLEGNLQGILKWPDQVSLIFEISSLERSQQLLSRGYRVIRIVPQSGSAGILPDQGILLAAMDAYLAAVRAGTHPSEPFTFLVDEKLYQGFGDLDYPTFVVTFQRLLEAA